MKSVNCLIVGIALGLANLAATASFGQVAPQNEVPANVAARGARTGPTFQYVLFWKQEDANTRQMAQVLGDAVAKRPGRANWTSINIKDPANRATVDHYGVSRAPMPLAICVADNGAVTGVFPRRPTDEALERALVTPKMAEVTKALQDKKIVLVHVQEVPTSPLPYGAVELMADPAFQARTTAVKFVVSDETESRFLRDMQINAAEVSGSMLVVMAPPSVLVGKFPATATKDDIAAQLHAAGKCCNDPNCKHNKKAQ